MDNLFKIKEILKLDGIRPRRKHIKRVGRFGRSATPLEQGYPMLFYYVDTNEAFCTTTIRYVIKDNNLVKVITERSIYVLERID